jgi:hypothetical protein
MFVYWWIVLYVTDYYFTLLAAKLYQSRVKERLVFEGSFELTPYFQDDINKLRLVSRRFILALLLSSVGLYIVWLYCVSWNDVPAVYAFTLGCLVLRELAIHIRHMRNISLFRVAVGPGGLKGNIEYPRWIILRQSGVELLGFAGLLLFLSAVTGSWFVLGGTFGCSAIAAKHGAWSKKCDRVTADAT